MISAFLVLLRSLSWQTWVVVGLAVTGAAIYGEKTARIHSLEHQLETVTKERDGLKAAIAAAQKLAADTSAKQTAAVKEIANDTKPLIAKARADAAVPSHARLLQRAAAVARSSEAASAPAGSSTAFGPGLVLADVLGRVDLAAGQLAAYADQARIAGNACAASYDALKGTP